MSSALQESTAGKSIPVGCVPAGGRSNLAQALGLVSQPFPCVAFGVRISCLLRSRPLKRHSSKMCLSAFVNDRKSFMCFRMSLILPVASFRPSYRVRSLMPLIVENDSQPIALASFCLENNRHSRSEVEGRFQHVAAHHLNG